MPLHLHAGSGTSPPPVESPGFAWVVFASHRHRDEALHKMQALETDGRGAADTGWAKMAQGGGGKEGGLSDFCFLGWSWYLCLRDLVIGSPLLCLGCPFGFPSGFPFGLRDFHGKGHLFVFRDKPNKQIGEGA